MTDVKREQSAVGVVQVSSFGLRLRAKAYDLARFEGSIVIGSESALRSIESVGGAGGVIRGGSMLS